METANSKEVFKLSWLSLVPHILLIGVFIGIITTPIQILRILTTRIEVDPTMVYGKTGILGKDVQNSPMKHIQSIRVDRSLLGRILGYGNITITTAGGGYNYKGMANPEKIRTAINGYL